MRALLLLLTVCLIGIESAGLAADGAAVAGDEVQAFLKAYCYECHGKSAEQGRLAIEGLASQADAYIPWIPVYDKLRTGQMPPASEKQPTAAERKQIVEILGRQLHSASSGQQQAEGRVVLRRLNLTEYETTLRDLLGPQVSIRELLPPDTVVAGFDNISAALDDQGRTVVEVRLVVRDTAGDLVRADFVQHVFTFDGLCIRRFDIEPSDLGEEDL